MNRYVLAITGTTGTVLGVRLLEVLLQTSEVHLIVSSVASKIIKEEAGVDLEKKFSNYKTLHLYTDKDLWAPPSSGSFQTEGMFVVPCSMKTLSGIANGYSQTLIERAADVTLKERRRLVLCPRETPFSAIHLENMLKLSRLGVSIVPPVIGFYTKPGTIEDIIDFIVGKILDQMRIHHNLFKRWS